MKGRVRWTAHGRLGILISGRTRDGVTFGTEPWRVVSVQSPFWWQTTVCSGERTLLVKSGVEPIHRICAGCVAARWRSESGRKGTKRDFVRYACRGIRTQ